MATNESNGVKEEVKPGVVRKVTKITFTVGPIRQEDLSTPEINRLMAMAQRFDISFDTVPILDSNQTDKLGYLTLPYEIRNQDYLLVLYDRLNSLKLSNNRDVSVKFPEELKKYVEECRTRNYEAKKKAIEEQKEKAELMKRSLYATYVDKDTGKDSLMEKFPTAKDIVLRQHNFQWFGCMEFETADEALKTLKQGNQIEIEDQKVKIVRQPPDYEEKKPSPQKQSSKPSGGFHQQKNRPHSGGMQSGGGGRNPKPLLAMGGNRGGHRGSAGGGGYGRGMLGAGPMYGDNWGGYGMNYGGGAYGGQGNYQLGAKRKSDLGDFGGSPKKPFGGSSRGGYGGGRGGGGGWGRY